VLFHVAGTGRDWENIGVIADEYPRMNLILAHMGPGDASFAQKTE
jgi:hypothetical protein